MSLRDEGFRFVFRDPYFFWIHPLEVRKMDVDCTDMSVVEYATFVKTVCENPLDFLTRIVYSPSHGNGESNVQGR